MLKTNYFYLLSIFSASLLTYQVTLASKVIYVDINEEIIKGPTVFYDQDIAFSEIDTITNTTKKPVTLLEVPGSTQLNIQQKLRNFDQEMAADNDVTYSIYDNFDSKQNYSELPHKINKIQSLVNKMPVLDKAQMVLVLHLHQLLL
ncbi:hypothetical protein L3V82_05515 [Thiotrichales bacterium 19S3-7]|nr:hypothetical protein [Thiotrichales bacterium 19S3-7]MCF6801551.1 hypothetical protein [Thiotrichales bacterium 19S3-11]